MKTSIFLILLGTVLVIPGDLRVSGVELSGGLNIKWLFYLKDFSRALLLIYFESLTSMIDLFLSAMDLAPLPISHQLLSVEYFANIFHIQLAMSRAFNVHQAIF